MLGRPRSGPGVQALEGALARLTALFAAAGAQPIQVPHLYLGETLLDLYGEDLRARAFLFPDAERGNELALRPDFTVPVALSHGDRGWDRKGTYSYTGPVFRRQPQGQGRPVEFIQAGLERFGDTDPVAADAEIFDLLHRGLRDMGIAQPQATIGDLSITFALLDALDMPAPRRAQLRRHFWRPGRFSALLSRAVQTAPDWAGRLIAGNTEDRALMALIETAGEAVGVRSKTAIASRAAALTEETAWPAMARDDAALIDEMLRIKDNADGALASMRAITQRAGVDIAPVLDRFEARLAALDARGHPAESLHFDAAFGRNLEYYDGFVFELRTSSGGAHPALAGGGRYDRLTERLGAARPVPAIGGIIRPEAVLAALEDRG